MTKHTALVVTAIVLSAAAAYAAQTGTFRIHAHGVEPATVSQLRADLAWAEDRVERWLGEFPDTVGVRVYPSRDAFTAALDQAWGIPETQCWMVGAGGAHALYLLAPDAWAEEACEHDPADREHVRQLVAHEAVHVLHSQVSPAEDLGLLEEIGWFTEGLATYVSGQLGSRHEGRAAEAIANGEAPAALADAWSGPYRYGVSGSMVAFIDAQWGRETLGRLLRATSQDEFLATLGSGETEFLDRWEGWVQQ